MTRCRADQISTVLTETDSVYQYQRLQLKLGPVNCQLRVSQNLGFEWLMGFDGILDMLTAPFRCALENLRGTLSSEV